MNIGSNIEIIMGDITEENVDAIVNAAHEALMGGGGVDGAIHRAAGPSLLRECRTIDEVEPGVRCRVGEACLTSGGNLPAKYVIHTVAPKYIGSVVGKYQTISTLGWSLTRNIYKNAKEGTDEDLKACYVNCLKLAEANDIRSIAFPSLGTGGHAYPIEVAAPIALETVKEMLPQLKSVSKIKLVCFSQEDYNTYVEEAYRLGMGDL